MFSLTETEDRTFEWYAGLSTAGTWAANVDPWVSWSKSQVFGCDFIDIIMIGAGGGGAGGFTKAVGANGGGGGGGASGGIVVARFPLWLLPETVYFFLPQGGRGGAANQSGSVGGRAAMLARPALTNPTVNETFLVSSATSTGAATAGTAVAAGAAGTPLTIGNITHAALSALAISVWWTIGRNGANGGSNLGAAGADIAALNLSGGAGGAGSGAAAFAGGNVTAADPITAVTGGAAGLPGDSGIQHIGNPFFPLCSSGGAGGGSTNTAATAGGNGGNAGVGSGGGGAGAGVSSGGTGGNGGDSYLLLVAS